MIRDAAAAKGALALLGAAAIYACFGPLVRVLEMMLGDYTQVAFRLGLAFVFLFILNRMRKNRNTLTRNQLTKALLLGVLFGSLVLLYTVAVVNTKIANAVFLLYAANLVTAFLVGTIFLRENVTIQKIIALTLALFGISMYTDVIVAFGLGVLAALASGVIEGVADGVRKLLSGADRRKVIEWQLLAAAAISFGATFFFEGITVKEISFFAVVVLILFALLQIKLGDWLLYGFQHFDVNIGTVILSLELVFAAILGFLFFGEVLTSKEIIGGVLIFAASIVSVLDFNRMFSRKQ